MQVAFSGESGVHYPGTEDSERSCRKGKNHVEIQQLRCQQTDRLEDQGVQVDQGCKAACDTDAAFSLLPAARKVCWAA